MLKSKEIISDPIFQHILAEIRLDLMEAVAMSPDLSDTLHYKLEAVTLLEGKLQTYIDKVEYK